MPITEEDTRLKDETPFVVMLNLLGGTLPDLHDRAAEAAKSIPGAHIHMYGKGDSRPGRKMGHVTILARSANEVEGRVGPLVRLLDHSGEVTKPAESSEFQIPPTSNSQDDFKNWEGQQPPMTRSRDCQVPLVAITMGSDSDRSVLAAGIGLLKGMEIPHIVTITSAHRTPERMFKFAREAASRGIKVIIAAAGGAAHLPGMIASITTLPVIGIPVKGSVLDGTDSLLSIVQMPVRQTCFTIPILRPLFSADFKQRGCPVATVAINNSINAAQLAVRILALDDVEIRKKLEEHLADQTASATEKGERMERVGFEAYGSEEI